MDLVTNVTTNAGLELFRGLVDTVARTENVFISTYGILSALSMLLLGTKESSENELLAFLHINKNQLGSYHGKFSALTSALISPSLSSANGIFVQNNLSLVESFLDDAEKFYSVLPTSADFASSPEEAREQINDWVKVRTHDKIPSLLGEPLDRDTLVFLVNAIHFKARWQYPFEAENTYAGNFHVSAEETVKCDMMMLTERTRELRIGNSDHLDCRMIELPYVGDFAMLILSPFVAGNLENVEKKLSSKLLREELPRLEKGFGMDPEIYLPRFKIEYEVELEDTLKAFGIESIFDQQRANLKGMINGDNISVSKVIHKAVVEVNEEGTEAAAVTGIGITFMSMPPQYRLDHPFLFVIFHRPTSTPVFVGRMSRPSPATLD